MNIRSNNHNVFLRYIEIHTGAAVLLSLQKFCKLIDAASSCALFSIIAYNERRLSCETYQFSWEVMSEYSAGVSESYVSSFRIRASTYYIKYIKFRNFYLKIERVIIIYAEIFSRCEISSFHNEQKIWCVIHII